MFLRSTFFSEVKDNLRRWRTHMVPATLVLTWVALGGRSLANPKSDILGVKSLSSNMLLAFISLCIIGGLISSWRNERPRATPKQSFTRVCQLNSRLSGFRPARKINSNQLVISWYVLKIVNRLNWKACNKGVKKIRKK